jgi:hypothetical protein
MFFKSDAAAGSNLYACVTSGVWAPVSQGTSGSSGGGSGSSTSSSPFDYQVSGSVLTIGTSCTYQNACRVLVGTTLHSFLTSVTATVSGGSGVAYVYVDSVGALTVGYGSGAAQNNLTCGGCTAVFNIAAFPDSVFPILKASWTNGVWDPNGASDERVPYSSAMNIQAGPNVIVTPIAGGVQISASGVGGTSASSGYSTLENAGSALPQRALLNFTGSGVSCSDDATNLRTNCNVSGGGSGGGSSYDATDVSVFDNTFSIGTLGYSNGAGAFWGFTGACAGVFNVVNASPGGIGLSFWNTGANSMCTLFAPWIGGAGIADFISGNSPLAYKEEIEYGRNTSTGDGDHYIGFSQAPAGGSGTYDNFVGIRGNSAAGQWQCVIRKNGADVVSTNITAIDTTVHWFRVHNNNGTANSVSCQIGSAGTTVSGTIPAGNWYGVAGAMSVSGSQPRFYAGEARLHIAGRGSN